MRPCIRGLGLPQSGGNSGLFAPKPSDQHAKPPIHKISGPAPIGAPRVVGAGLMRIVDRFPGSTQGSRLRRAFSYVVMAMSLVLAVEVGLAEYGVPLFYGPWVTGVLAGLSVVYFAVVLVAVIFLTSHKFRVDPVRLALDGALSALFMTLTFATLYRHLGISLNAGCDMDFRPIDSVYFSAVTFTTLGYGDFRPCAWARLPASGQALLGNLHLGIIVGAAFFLAQDPPRRPEQDLSTLGDEPPEPDCNDEARAAEHQD